jgi:S-(hydroxymethyl)glutathione dehydrogenase/alcohol dehydrogenase
MKAAILTKLNAPLTVDGVMLPEKLDYGQVLVKLRVSGICGAQLQEIAGHKGNAGLLPHLLGHEGSGVVDQVGPGVTRVKPGEQVVLHWRKAAGIEAAFPQYKWWQTRRGGTLAPIPVAVGAGKVTTLSEFAVVSENRVTPVPAGTPDELCALLGCGLSTALGTIERDAAVKFGESVLIVGCGGLGANLIRAARLVGAHVTVMDVHESKRELALGLGAPAFVNFLELKNSKHNKLFFDVIIDTSGAGMERTLPLLAPSGRYIMVGQPKPGATVKILNAAHLFAGEGKSIKATQGGGFRPELDIPRYIRLHAAGVLDIRGIVSERLPLKDINRALDLVRAGNASRVMIQF